MMMITTRSVLAMLIGSLCVTSAYAASSDFPGGIEGQVTQNSESIAAQGSILKEHHDAFVATGNALASIKTDISDNKTTLLEHHSALVAAGNEINEVKHNVANMGSSVYIQHQALVAAGNEINTLKADVKETQTANENQQHFIAHNTKNIAAVQKTISAMGDVESAKRYQGMINARHDAEQEALQQEVKTLSVSIPQPNVDRTKEVASFSKAIEKTHSTLTTLTQKQQQDKALWSQKIQTLATDTTNSIASDRQQIISTQQRVDSNAAQLSKLNSNFSSLKHTVDENKHEAAAGSSSAMAQANIPQVLNGQTVAIGAGVGGYDGESAIAVGVSFRAADSVTVKATVSDDSQQNVGYGAGVSVGW